MSEKKQKRERYMTPKGVAVFPWLNNPDTKFKAEGEYRVALRMPADEVAPLIEKLQPKLDKAVAEAKKDPKRKGKKLTVHEFVRPVLDDDGNETGDVEMRFKMTASGISKKTGKPWAMKPDLFDAQGRPLSEEARIFGGSVMKVCFSAEPFDKPIGIGLSLRLEAAQVIKLVSSTRDASSYGFGNEGDEEDEEEESADEGDAAAADEGEEGGEDF